MKKKILLLGTHGQYNWGDDLLLETFLTQLGADNEYYVNSYDPEATKNNFKDDFLIETFHTIQNPFKLLKYIFKSDVVFFAGGTIIRELYKSSGRNKYSSMLMVFVLVFFVKNIARKKIIMSNIGVGPVTTRVGKYIAKIVLNHTDYVSLRDQQSFDLAMSFNTKQRNMVVVPDAIFIRAEDDFINGKNTFETDSKNLNKPILKIGLNLNFDIANPLNWNHFINNLADVFTILSKEFDLKIHTIPMQIAFNPKNDVIVLNEFIKMLPNLKFIEHIPQSAKEIGVIIRNCDLIVAERFHTIVLSTILGVPFVALEYDVKVNSLVNRLNMQNYAVNINKKFEVIDVVAMMKSAVINNKAIRAELKVKASLYNLELSNYFSNLNKLIKNESK